MSINLLDLLKDQIGDAIISHSRSFLDADNSIVESAMDYVIQDMTEIDNLAIVLNTYSNINIEVGGHTDNSGETDKNLALSQNRADAVKALLIAQGVPENIIITKGFGSYSPATDDAVDAANRRIEFKIIN